MESKVCLPFDDYNSLKADDNILEEILIFISVVLSIVLLSSIITRYLTIRSQRQKYQNRLNNILIYDSAKYSKDVKEQFDKNQRWYDKLRKIKSKEDSDRRKEGQITQKTARISGTSLLIRRESSNPFDNNYSQPKTSPKPKLMRNDDKVPPNLTFYQSSRFASAEAPTKLLSPPTLVKNQIKSNNSVGRQTSFSSVKPQVMSYPTLPAKIPTIPNSQNNNNFNFHQEYSKVQRRTNPISYRRQNRISAIYVSDATDEELQLTEKRRSNIFDPLQASTQVLKEAESKECFEVPLDQSQGNLAKIGRQIARESKNVTPEEYNPFHIQSNAASSRQQSLRSTQSNHKNKSRSENSKSSDSMARGVSREISREIRSTTNNSPIGSPLGFRSNPYSYRIPRYNTKNTTGTICSSILTKTQIDLITSFESDEFDRKNCVSCHSETCNYCHQMRQNNQNYVDGNESSYGLTTITMNEFNNTQRDSNFSNKVNNQKEENPSQSNDYSIETIDNVIKNHRNTKIALKEGYEQLILEFGDDESIDRGNEFGRPSQGLKTEHENNVAVNRMNRNFSNYDNVPIVTMVSEENCKKVKVKSRKI